MDIAPDRLATCPAAETIEISGSERSGPKHNLGWAKAAVAVAIAIVAAFDLLFRLGAPDWLTDESTYKTAGWTAFHGGNVLAEYETPPLAKHIIGVFEIVFGRTEVPVRLSAVAAAIVTGVVLALIARRVAGDWAALATAAVWFVLPHPGAFKLERFALLDIFMAMFTTIALFFAVMWGESPKWRWVIGAGVAIGFAAACKQPGALVLIPIGIFVVAVGNFSGRSFRQLAVLTGAAVAAFVATYAPAWGQMPDQVTHMVEFQSHQRSVGHAVLVGGHAYLHPPWWTTLRWQWDASWLLALCYLAVIVITIVRARRNPNLALLLGVLVTNVGFFAFVSRNDLEHYPYAWAPVLALMTGLAITDLARRTGWAKIAAVVLALALVVPAVQLIDHTARIRRTDYAATAELLRTTYGTRLRLVVVGYPNVLGLYLPYSVFVPDSADGKVNAIIVDPMVTGRLDPQWHSTYLATHPGAFIEHTIGRLHVYLPGN